MIGDGVLAGSVVLDTEDAQVVVLGTEDGLGTVTLRGVCRSAAANRGDRVTLQYLDGEWRAFTGTEARKRIA